MSTPSTLPSIVAVGYKDLSRLIHSLTPEYRHLANIRIIDDLFDDAVATARIIDQQGEADIFLSGGANGAFLRDTVSRPVAQIKISGIDLIRAIKRAQKISDRIAFVTYQQKNNELNDVNELLAVDIEQRTYATVDDVRDQVHDLAALGYKVIIGASLVIEYAEKNKLSGILIYSPNSIRQAIENAIEISSIQKIEAERSERLSTILRHLNEGVISVDLDQKIQSINPAMEVLLGISENQALGKKLPEINSAMSLTKILEEGRMDLQSIEQIGKQTIVVNRIPIKNNGLISGAVMTFQPATAIEYADRNIRAKNRASNLSAKYRLEEIIAHSGSISQAKILAAQYSRTNSTIIITGESGTGKELFAQGIHNASDRSSGPFVAVNCAAISESILENELFGHEEGSFTGARRGGKEGFFEAAHTGTIFLDEIGDMPISLQTRLLRVLQEKEVVRIGGNQPVPVDIRVVTATNKNLKHMVAEKLFRDDLYYRLNILHLHLPPLKERPEDILPLLQHLTLTALRKNQCDKDAEPLIQLILPSLTNYAWPGNIREMENFTERLAVFYRDIDITKPSAKESIWSIIPEVRDQSNIGNVQQHPTTPRPTNKIINDGKLSEIIRKYNGNQSLAAKALGISRTTLWRRLKHEKKPNQ
ncbi:MAG: propionate catabolism operon regulatory protein PrpR [Porticoccaceae bacterium]